MERIDNTHFVIRTYTGRVLHVIKARGLWDVRTTTGGRFASFGTLPVCRKWITENFS